jgi:hypothetical protein
VQLDPHIRSLTQVHRDPRMAAIVDPKLRQKQLPNTKLIGRPVKTLGPQNRAGATPAKEQIAMYNFFNETGYDVDIADLRKRYHPLQNLEQHLRLNSWKDAQLVPIPKTGNTW